MKLIKADFSALTKNVGKYSRGPSISIINDLAVISPWIEHWGGNKSSSIWATDSFVETSDNRHQECNSSRAIRLFLNAQYPSPGKQPAFLPAKHFPSDEKRIRLIRNATPSIKTQQNCSFSRKTNWPCRFNWRGSPEEVQGLLPRYQSERRRLIDVVPSNVTFNFPRS